MFFSCIYSYLYILCILSAFSVDGSVSVMGQYFLHIFVFMDFPICSLGFEGLSKNDRVLASIL